MTNPRNHRSRAARCVAFCAGAAALAGCAGTTVRVRPDQLPAITDAAEHDARMRGTVIGRYGDPVRLDGYLESIEVVRQGPGAEREAFKPPMTAKARGGTLVLDSRAARRVYAPSELAYAEVTVEDRYESRRNTGWGLTIPGLILMGGAGVSLGVIAKEGGELSTAILLGMVSAPLAITGVVLTAVGVPFLVSGYGEPDKVNPIKATGWSKPDVAVGPSGAELRWRF